MTKIEPLKKREPLLLANLPTRIEKLDKLSRELDGVNLYIKRDDFTGVELSGNKIRKLEFIMEDVIDKGCDCLITCGGTQSNHARATAALAAKLGLKSYLLLKGSEKDDQNGNYFLDGLFGADIKFINGEDYKYRRNDIMEELKIQLEKSGHKAYIIPEGASNGLGNFGYIKAFEEIHQQEQSLGIDFDAIVVAVGSGGTYGGLFLGSRLMGSRKKIFGINIYDDQVDFNEKIYKLMLESKTYFDVDGIIDKNHIEIINDYVGLGYAQSKKEELDFIRYIARKEGLVLDTVYTGKAFYGLMEEIKKGRFGDKSNILFIHTGGLFGMFSKKNLF